MTLYSFLVLARYRTCHCSTNPGWGSNANTYPPVIAFGDANTTFAGLGTIRLNQVAAEIIFPDLTLQCTVRLLFAWPSRTTGLPFQSTLLPCACTCCMQSWDVVVVDPPSFAPNKNAVAAARESYERVFGLAAQVRCVKYNPGHLFRCWQLCSSLALSVLFRVNVC